MRHKNIHISKHNIQNTYFLGKRERLRINKDITNATKQKIMAYIKDWHVSENSGNSV